MTMAIRLYDVTVPVFQRGLDRLGAVLEKGREHALSTSMPLPDLLNARLAPDMLTLTGQVQRASDTAKFTVVRVGEVPNESFADDEQSFEDLQDRIARTQAFLGKIPRGALDGKEDTMISATIGRMPVTIAGRDYALSFALPNFYFHVTTAYGLLRNKGVPLGKMDYIGPIQPA
jgi:hypothetical protein